MIGIVLTCYERPEYLKHTLESIKNTPYTKDDFVMVIIDDASVSLETQELIKHFWLDNVKILKFRNKERMGVSYNLLKGFDVLNAYDCTRFMNIDSDVDLKFGWIYHITQLLNQFPDRICTGFNANNTTRLPVVAEHDYYEKQYIGGLNVAFNLCNYDKVILSLQPDDVWQKGNAWDWHLCDIMKKEGKTFLVTKPGVIQHCGIESTLGHKGGDVDLNFKKDE